MTDKEMRKIIKSWRWRIARAGMTEKKFSEDHAKVDRSMMSRYLTGNVVPTPLTFTRIEDALKSLGV